MRSYSRWMWLLLGFCSLILLLGGCGNISDDTWTLGYKHHFDYVPSHPDIPTSLIVDYKISMTVDTGLTHTLAISTAGVLSTQSPVLAFGAIQYKKELTVPIKVEIDGKGEGILQVSHQIMKGNGFPISKQIFILVTDEGVFLSDQSVSATYIVYLDSLKERQIISNTDYSRRLDRFSSTNQITATINGISTIFDVSVTKYR